MAVTTNLVTSSKMASIVFLLLLIAQTDCSPVDIGEDEEMMIDVSELAEDLVEEGSGDSTSTSTTTSTTVSASTTTANSTATSTTMSTTTSTSSTSVTSAQVPADHPIPGWGLAIICLAVAVIVFAAGWFFFVRYLTTMTMYVYIVDHECLQVSSEQDSSGQTSQLHLQKKHDTKKDS